MAKRLGGALAWTLVVLVALVVSLAYHVQLRLGGVVAIEALTALLNREIRGELSVGRLEHVSFDNVVATGVVVRDPEGREVIDVARVQAWPDWDALWHGVVRVERVRLRGAEVRLFVSGPDEDTVSIVEAFQPAEPRTGPPGNPPRVIVDDIVLDEVLVHGDVPGLAGLRVEDVRVRGRVTAQREVRFTVWEGRGVLTGPYAGRTHIDNIVGFFDSDLADEGMEFFARARRGPDRVRARIRLERPDPEAPPHIDLRAAAEPLSTDTLREMEVIPDLGGLSASVRGYARLEGPADDLTLRGDLHAPAGSVRLRGRLPREGTLTLEVETDRLRLDQLVDGAPATVLSGRGRLELEPAPDGAQARRIHLALDPLTIDDVAIPSFTMDGVLEDDALLVTGLDAEHAGGETHASGRVGFDGSLDLHVSARLPDVGADPNVRRAMPGARGALSADLDVRADEGAENLRFAGRIAMRHLRYGSVRADRLTVRGTGGGALPAPRLDLSGDADGLVVGELSLGHAEVTIRGGPEGYAIDARSADPRSGTRVAVVGRATVQDRTWRLSAPELLVDLGDGPWRGSADVRLTPGRSVELRPVVLARDGERIVAEGTYRFTGEDELDVELLGVDLGHFRALAPDRLEGVGGRVDGRLALRGDLARRPQGRLSARVRDGEYGGLTGITGEVDLALEGDLLTTDVRLDLGGAGELAAEGPIRVPPSALREPSRLIEEARFEGLRVSAADLDVAPLLALAGLADDVRVSGRITTDAELTGTLRLPGVRDAFLVLDRVVLGEDWDPLRAKVHLGFGDERLTVYALWLADAAGELVTAEGHVPLPLQDLPQDRAGWWRLARSGRWSLSARLPQRRLDGYPRPLAEGMPPALAASASVSARNDDGVMRADIDAVGRWVDAAVDARCAADLRPLVTVRGHLEGDVATGSIVGFFGGDRATLFADWAAGLPLDEWVRAGDVPEFPSTEVVARLRGAEMSEVPWLCDYGHGPIDASLTAKDLLTGRSVVGAVLDLPRLQIWETVGERGEAQLSTEYRVHVRAGSTPERDALTACTVLGIAGVPGTDGEQCREVEGPADGELLARLRVPVRWTAGELLPAYVDGGMITSVAQLRQVHVEPILTLVPGIVTGDAVMDGSVRVAGPFEDLRMAGGLDLSEGHLQIEGLGQHLFDIEGRVELNEDEAVFPADRPLSARDAGGLATAYGRVGFEGIVPRSVNLQVRANDFPVRREGMVLAWLSGRAAIEGDITDEHTTSRIRTRDFVVRLPDQTAGDLQPLEPHTEILIVGEERPLHGAEDEDTYPVYIRINPTDRRSDPRPEPFWVRRSDFAALLTAQIDAEYRAPNLYVEGRADILRGTFEIFGKRFELQSGSSLVFTRSADGIDPTVNIVAIYEVPGRRGVTVTVTVAGTLTEPEINFTSTETSDRAEIIALLIAGGRRDAGAAERQASEQAASFLAGLTAGILTLGLRQELGDVIPMLAIESEGLGGTRVRVGFNANELIPDFMRGFVTSAYIEGFVTAAADGVAATSGAGAIGGGVTVEFTLPAGFLLRGTYVPIDNGSIDLLFEP